MRYLKGTKLPLAYVEAISLLKFNGFLKNIFRYPSHNALYEIFIKSIG